MCGMYTLLFFFFLYRLNPSDTRGGYYEGTCSKRRRKKGAVMRVSAAERCALIRGALASNNRFAPLARNGKCISVDRAQTKGRTFVRGLSPSRFLPFRAVLPSGVSFHLTACPVLLSRVTLARQIPVLELSKD